MTHEEFIVTDKVPDPTRTAVMPNSRRPVASRRPGLHDTERYDPRKAPHELLGSVSREIVAVAEHTAPAEPPPPVVEVEDQAGAVLVQFWVGAEEAEAIIALRHGTVGSAKMSTAAQRTTALSAFYEDAGKQAVRPGLQRWTKHLTRLAEWAGS